MAIRAPDGANNTLPRGGMYQKICPLGQFVPRGLRDCPRPERLSEGNLGGQGVHIAEGAYFPIHPDPR